MDIQNMKYKELQALAAEKGIKSVGVSKEDLIAAIQRRDGHNSWSHVVEQEADEGEQGVDGISDDLSAYEGNDMSDEVGPWQATPNLTSDFEPEPPKKKNAEPAPVDNATAIAMMAVQMAEKAMAQFTAAQTEQKKPSTPEAVIEQRRKSDKQAIAQLPKVDFYIPWYPGAPKVITSTVNGSLFIYPLGKKCKVSIAHAENLERSFNEKRANADKFAAMEREAKRALGLK